MEAGYDKVLMVILIVIAISEARKILWCLWIRIPQSIQSIISGSKIARTGLILMTKLPVNTFKFQL